MQPKLYNSYYLKSTVYNTWYDDYLMTWWLFKKNVFKRKNAYISIFRIMFNINVDPYIVAILAVDLRSHAE